MGTGPADNGQVRRAVNTRAAANYLGISVSLLRKLRLRGPDDPYTGPRFIKVSPSLVLYELAALDEWLDVRALEHERAVERTTQAAVKHTVPVSSRGDR